MNIGRATEYRNTSQLFTCVNLVKIVCVEGAALDWRRRADGRGGSGPQKKISILSFEMLNFYAFWTGAEIVQQL